MTKNLDCLSKKCLNKNLSFGLKGKEGIISKLFQNIATITLIDRKYNEKYKVGMKIRRKYKAYFCSCNKDLKIGDLIEIRETKPLAKTINYVVYKNKSI